MRARLRNLIVPGRDRIRRDLLAGSLTLSGHISENLVGRNGALREMNKQN